MTNSEIVLNSYLHSEPILFSILVNKIVKWDNLVQGVQTNWPSYLCIFLNNLLYRKKQQFKNGITLVGSIIHNKEAGSAI